MKTSRKLCKLIFQLNNLCESYLWKYSVTLFCFRSKYDTKKMHVEVRPEDVSAGGNVWKQQEPPLKAEDKMEVDMDPVLVEVRSEEPEQDWDDVYHKQSEELLQYLAPLMGDYKADAVVRIFYTEPEKDEDEVQTENEQKISEDKAARVYLQPEEDKDDLYHKDVEQLLFQSDPKAAAPIDVASPRKHSKAEEDLDDLYHQ